MPSLATTPLTSTDRRWRVLFPTSAAASRRTASQDLGKHLRAPQRGTTRARGYPSHPPSHPVFSSAMIVEGARGARSHGLSPVAQAIPAQPARRLPAPGPPVRGCPSVCAGGDGHQRKLAYESMSCHLQPKPRPPAPKLMPMGELRPVPGVSLPTEQLDTKTARSVGLDAEEASGGTGATLLAWNPPHRGRPSPSTICRHDPPRIAPSMSMGVEDVTIRLLPGLDAR
jgi:hypothetical protein